jgi:phosphoglucomutase
MDFRREYLSWLESPALSDEERAELRAIRDDDKEIESRFFSRLEFGTAGLRGIMGTGLYRMNRHVVRHATQAFAEVILEYCAKQEKPADVAICYDCRNNSREFAREAAAVMAANGIHVRIFESLRPTPELSFAIREYGLTAGVNITASHNPKEYNGYKVYGEDGAQLSLEGSEAVLEEIEKIDDITSIVPLDTGEASEKGLLRMIGGDMDDAYISSLRTLSINPEIIKQTAGKLKIVYTPLHGTGNKPVRRILKETGFEDVLVVREQELPDPEFSTVKYPNPEERDSFKLAIELAEREDVDLIIGTDPDCDRVGVVVRNSAGEYAVLTGNQTGSLLLEYILSQKKRRGSLPANGFAVKTIVTSELARAIADDYGVELIEVLTGFKFIGEKIKELDEFGDRKYLFGFEESYGYLAGTFVRDKDGVVACMLIGEMAAYYRSMGMSLYEGLDALFKKYGYYLEGINSFTLEGREGIEKISAAMETLRAEKPSVFGTLEASALRDYQTRSRYDLLKGAVTGLDLPQSNVLYYEMKDGSWFCIRPSGTEPKIKIYYGVSDETREKADQKLELLKENVLSVIRKHLL